MASQDPSKAENGAASEWKSEGHPWVDNGLQVAGPIAVPTSRNTAATAYLTGSVVSFGPKNENQRKPALGRVIFEAPTQPPTLRSMPENVVLAMDLTGTEIQDLQKLSAANDAAMEEGAKTTQQTLRMASAFPIANGTLMQNVRERYETRMEQYLKESVLPPLIALAALEEATTQMVKQRIAQEDAEHAARATSSNNSGKLSSPHPPLYYTKPPNQYMTPPSAASSSATNGADSFTDPTKQHLSSTPAAWLSRIKLGCQQAWNEHLTQHQQEKDLLQIYSQVEEVELSTGRRSSSRIARITTEQWEQTKTRQTRSAKHQGGSGVEICLKGHRISSYLQNLWESEQNKRTDEDKIAEEAEEAEDEEEHEEEEEDEDDLDLFNPYLQPAYGDVLKSLRKVRLEDIQNSIPYWCQETHSRTSAKARRQQLDEEEEMENVLEVDVLPLDNLILGIEENVEEDETEEHAEDIEEPVDKMEVEPTASATEADACKDNASAKDTKTDSAAPAETTKATEAEKQPEKESGDSKAPESTAPSEAAKTADALESNETKADDAAKEDKSKVTLEEKGSSKAEAAATPSEDKPEAEAVKDVADGKENGSAAAEESAADQTPTAADGKDDSTKQESATSAGSVPDVAMKTEAPSADTNGHKAEAVKSADASNGGTHTKKEESASTVKTESSTVEIKVVKEVVVKEEVKSAALPAGKDKAGKDADKNESPNKSKSSEEGDEKPRSKDDDENEEAEEEHDYHQHTENMLLQWEIPDSIEKAPSKNQVYKYLQTQENPTFGRFTFSLRRQDEEMERLRRELEGGMPDEGQLRREQEANARRKEVERAFQTKKNWDKWRFEGIHGGHTVWPKWQDAVREWQAERNAKQSGEGAAAGETTAAPDHVEADRAPDQVEADRAKALELAQKENEADVVAAAGTAASRRTRRKATSSAGTVFYGQSSQLTARQLVELILRLCSEKSTAPTILHLQSIVAEDGTQDPIRRLRSALGKLVWRRNQLARLTPSTDWTDKYLFETLREKPLLQIAPPPPLEAAAPPEAAADSGTSGTANDVEMKDASNEDAKPPAMDHKEEEETLLQYLQYLHQTELHLRKVVLEHLTEIPKAIVATAADEKKGSNEGYDSADFEDQSEVEWQTEGHEMIGKHIFRPPQMTNTNDLSTCEWYTIKAYVPSVLCEAAPDEPPQVAGSSVKDSRLVDRRMRFRAAPFLESDEAEVEFDDEEYLVLTEAQVKAGVQAADLEQISLDEDDAKEEASFVDHPFAGSGLSAKITLYPITKSKKKGVADPIQFTVVGHDSVPGDASAETVHRILVLPHISEEDPAPTSVWATLDISDDTEIRCTLADDPMKFRVQQSDFHPESQAFADCRKIVDFLENHTKAAPFLEPVDHVALNIPDYPKVCPNPMDISTLADKLENGHYSNVAPKQTAGRSPVARMLNGPFRDDVELIFDNAKAFNPAKDWIHQDAVTLQKAVIRKLESISQSADLKFRRSGRNQAKQSIYLDEDSDVDMYEYESDNDDDDDYGGSRKKRKRGKGPVRPKADDNSTRAMEHAIRLQKTVSETLGLRGPFANLPVENDASSFVHPPNWNCRRKKPGAKKTMPVDAMEEDEESDTKPEATDKYEEEMEQLVELQRTIEETETTGLRRSTRAVQDEGGSRHRGKKSGAKSDIEYFMLNELEKKHVRLSEDLSRMPPPSTRQDVEYLCERLHDSFYANLHKDLSGSLVQAKLAGEKENGGEEKEGEDDLPIGAFANGSFPPFLGRMVPVSLAKHGKFSWEIRAPFQIPALRWVIRGLIQSGHIGEIEPLEVENMSSGVIMANDVYYADSSLEPFDVLDSKELARRRRANNEGLESSEDEVELSEYEKLRAERVARNAERLKALGLA